VADAARVGDLRPGDHACLTFSDSEERLDIVAAFVRDGLNANRRVLCLTDTLSPTSFDAELTVRGLPVDAAAGTGQMSVLTSGDTFLAGGAFEAARMISLLTEQVAAARRDGFAGLWLTSDMCWALRPVSGLDQLWDYESAVSRLLAESRATAVCQYDRQGFDTVTLAHIGTSHATAVSAATYHDDAMLRICRQYQPPGVRVSGEIDYRRTEPLTRALAEALALDDHVHVNLAGLIFTDGSAAGVLMQSAASLRDGQLMTVQCRAQAGKLLRALGLAELLGVTMVVVDDE
jgi:anti-anti-sigma regulatory factor